MADAIIIVTVQAHWSPVIRIIEESEDPKKGRFASNWAGCASESLCYPIYPRVKEYSDCLLQLQWSGLYTGHEYGCWRLTFKFISRQRSRSWRIWNCGKVIWRKSFLGFCGRHAPQRMASFTWSRFQRAIVKALSSRQITTVSFPFSPHQNLRIGVGYNRFCTAFHHHNANGNAQINGKHCSRPILPPWRGGLTLHHSADGSAQRRSYFKLRWDWSLDIFQKRNDKRLIPCVQIGSEEGPHSRRLYS